MRLFTRISLLFLVPYFLLCLSLVFLTSSFLLTLFSTLGNLVFLLYYSIAALVSLVGIRWWFKRYRWRSLRPFFFHLLALAIVVLFTFSHGLSYMNFHVNYAQRMMVVQLYQHHQLQLKGAYPTNQTFLLPSQYGWMSNGSEIRIDGHGDVIFYDYKGILEGFSAYVYDPNAGKQPAMTACDQQGYGENLDTHWSYITCTP